jgi:ATP/maltotriose-dependent transcriptional regulator MalT
MTSLFLNLASSLIDKSLLQTRNQEAQDPRLYLLETVREYALERLVESGEIERTQEAHAAYYLALAEQAESELYAHQQYSWLDRLDRDNENLRAALSFLLERNDRARAVRLTRALGWFWYMRGRLAEGMDWSEQALAQSRRVGSQHVLKGAYSFWAEGRSLTPEEALAALGMPRVRSAECGVRSSEGSIDIPHSPSAIPHSALRPAGLTRRELEALLLVAEGLSNDQIADRLVVSTATVKTYLSAIYNKLGVSSRTAAMRYVIDHRLDIITPSLTASTHS